MPELEQANKMKPFDTLWAPESLDAFQMCADGNFSYLDTMTNAGTFQCTHFRRIAAFTGHVLSCTVLAEDFNALDVPSAVARLAEVTA